MTYMEVNMREGKKFEGHLSYPVIVNNSSQTMRYRQNGTFSELPVQRMLWSGNDSSRQARLRTVEWYCLLTRR
jgi:hypothetical protein